MGYTSYQTPGHCATVTAAGDYGPRTGPHLCETGPLAGWEVELPVVKKGGLFSKREIIAKTTLPSGLARVMGEAEYVEQVEELNEMIERQFNRTWRVKAAPYVALFGAFAIEMLAMLVSTILLTTGVISDTAFLIISVGPCFLIVACFPLMVVGIMYGNRAAKRYARENSEEILQLTSRWNARGIAWRFKQSEPIPAVQGKHNTLVARYSQRVTVECAPDAIDLFEQHGPFLTSGTVAPGHLDDYGTVRDESKGFVKRDFAEEADGIRFWLPYADVTFNKDPWLQPAMPLMLRNVMSKGEYAEQVAVINNELLKATKKARVCGYLAMASIALMLPSILLVFVPAWIAAYFELEAWGAVFVAMMVIIFAPLLCTFLFLLLAWHYRIQGEHEMQVVLESQTHKWDDRGLEWFYSKDAFTLHYGQQTKDVIERRATIRVKPNAKERFQALGPFNPGEIDGAVCREYQLAAI